MRTSRSQMEQMVAALAVAMLLILTATGNAIALFLGSAAGLVLAFAYLRPGMARHLLLACLLAAVVAGTVVLAIGLL